MPLSRRLREDETGVALVEFALVLPLLLVLLFGMLDFGRAFNYWIDATHLANEGARWAVVNKNPGTGSLQQFVQQQADTDELRNGGSSAVPDPLEVCITFPPDSVTGQSGVVGAPVKVSASLTYHWLPFLSKHALGGLLSTTVVGSSTMRIEQEPTNYTTGCA
jgi:Flp pilus assembly protein TadG